MRNALISLAAITAVAFAAPAVQAQNPGGAAAQLAADPLNTNAPYAFIMDGDTGLPLYCKDCNEPLIPASMSKLMVYYLVFDRLKEGRIKLDDEFTVSEHAWRTGGAATGGSTMFLRIGSKVSVENLLRGAVIQSGNDACIVLAEGISGSEQAFAREMTARAQELGLTNSNFINATGLDAPGHYMSAADIALIGYRIIHDFPEFYELFREPEFTWNNIRQPNRNPLLRELPGSDGIKTGHLSASGYGLVGSAVRDGQRRIIVLQGLRSETERRQEGARVMRAAFSDFTVADVVKTGTQVATADVWLGEKKQTPLVAAGDLQLGLHVDALRRMNTVVSFMGPLRAPVKKGDVVGELIVNAPGVPEQRVPVAVGEDVKKLGLIGRAIEGIRGS